MKKHGLILNGKRVTEAEFHRGGKVGGDGIPMIATAISEARPWTSDSLGVLPHQVPEARAALAKEKDLTAVRILDNGAVECTSPGDTGRMGWIKYKGAVDNDGGYKETYNTKS